MGKGVLFGLLFLGILLVSAVGGVNAATYADCATVPGAELNGRTCIEKTTCDLNLNVEGSYYLLLNDVVSDDSCFKITNNNVTLDLNNKTVIFDNEVAPVLNNPGFESETGTTISNWDLSGASDSSVVGPGNYINARGEWVPDQIENNVLKFTSPSSEQYVYSDWITIDPSQYYTLSVLTYRPIPYKSSVTAQLEDDLGNTCTVSDTTWSDLEHWAADPCTFSPISSSVRVKLGVSGAVPEDVYFDGVMLKRGNYALDNNMYNDVNQFGVYTSTLIDDLRITNGKIMQGQAGTFYARGIQSFNPTRLEIDNLNISLYSPDTMGMALFTSTDVFAHHNTLTLTGRRTELNHNGGSPSMWFQMGYGTTGLRIYSNNITYAPHGIYIRGGGPPGGNIYTIDDFEIYDNNVRIESNAIHSYCFTLGGQSGITNFSIYDNFCNTTSGGGMLFDGYEEYSTVSDGPNNGQIYNNYVEIRDGPQEERNWVSKAIWTRYGVHDLDFYNNTVVGYAGIDVPRPGANSSVIGIRLGSQEPYGKNLTLRNNYVRTYTNSESSQTVAASLALDTDFGPTGVDKYIFNNTFESNRRCLTISSAYGKGGLNNLFESNTFVKSANALPNFETIRGGYWVNGPSVVFLDTKGVNGADVHDLVWSASSPSFFNVTLSWFLDVLVNSGGVTPLENVNVEIRDNTDTIVDSGLTGVNGGFRSTLKEIEFIDTATYPPGPSNTTFTPYNVSVIYLGEMISRLVTLNQSKTEVFTFANDCSEGAITSQCTCGSADYEVGYCCDLTNTLGGIYFDPGYNGCPAGNWYYVDQNNPSASDSNPGTDPNFPWLTLKHATDTVNAGSTVIVKQGRYTDTSSTWARAFSLANDGTQGNPINFKSYPPYSAVLVRNSGGVPAFQSAEDVHYVTIDGFKAEGKIGCRADCTNIVIKNNEVTNGSIEGTDTTLNYGISVQFGCKDCLIENNYVHDIEFSGMDIHNTAGIIVFGGASLGYINTENVTVQNNYVDCGNNNVYSAYGQKGGSIYNSTWRYNFGKNCRTGFLGIASTSKTHPSEDNTYYQNIITDSDSFFGFNHNTSRFKVYNNVGYNNLNFITTYWLSNPETFPIWNLNHSFWNNIGASDDYSYNIPYPNNNFESLINYSNYNNLVSPIIGVFSSEYSALRAYYNTLNNWQQAFGFDMNSIESDPQFVNVAGEDFHLTPGSPAESLGMDRQDYDGDFNTTERIPAGVYITGNEVIGIIDYTIATAPSQGNADVNSDGVVNIIDLALTVYWQGTSTSPGDDYNHLDIIEDGTINWLDVLEVLSRI